jgi:hypothetical protein
VTVAEKWIHMLLGGIPTPLKNMKVSWDYYFQYIESHNPVMFQSPPSRYIVIPIINHYEP